MYQSGVINYLSGFVEPFDGGFNTVIDSFLFFVIEFATEFFLIGNLVFERVDILFQFVLK